MENINLELYKVFYFVAYYKNITKASEILLISQPAITQSIKKLESEIGYTLFYRTSRGVELTQEGLKLYEKIKDPISSLNTCKATLDNSTITNIIKIGGGTTLLKYNSISGIKKFRNKYPNIKFEITKGITSELLKELENNKLDLVLFNMPIAANENIMYEVIEEFQDVFVASYDFAYLKDKKLNIEDLTNLPFVLQSSVSSSRKYLDNICKKNKIKIDGYELESYDLVLEFVKAGLGIGFVNINHVKDAIKKKKLFILNINCDIPKRCIGIAYNRKNINNKVIKQFIDYIK